MKRFMGLYRDRTIRRKGHDYSNGASYLISICTEDRAQFFGRVVDAGVRLSEAGRIVNEEWQRTGELRPNVRLDSRVVMPDHFQAVIHLLERPATAQLAEDGNGPAVDSLGEIIGRFKGACTRRIRETTPDFAWQAGFHDRILRSRTALGYARRYLRRNPREWEQRYGRPRR